MPKRESTDLARVLSSKAASDEAILAKLLDDPDVPDDALGFHAQQAAEKLLKAVLAYHDVEFERTHNIEYLAGLLKDNGISAPPSATELHELTPWAIEFRYEEPFGRSSIDRKRVGELVKAVRDWANKAQQERE